MKIEANLYASIMSSGEAKDLLKDLDWKNTGNGANATKSVVEAKDPLKDLNWKNMGSGANATKNVVENGQTVVKKRPRKKFREIPEYYFLPRKSLPSAIAFYGSFIVAGVGAGMLVEAWIKKKVKEDGGVIWEFDK